MSSIVVLMINMQVFQGGFSFKYELCLNQISFNHVFFFLSVVGREYTIPSPLHRFLAEMVDFFILFCIKATIVLWIMHLSGMK